MILWFNMDEWSYVLDGDLSVCLSFNHKYLLTNSGPTERHSLQTHPVQKNIVQTQRTFFFFFFNSGGDFKVSKDLGEMCTWWWVQTMWNKMILTILKQLQIKQYGETKLYNIKQDIPININSSWQNNTFEMASAQTIMLLHDESYSFIAQPSVLSVISNSKILTSPGRSREQLLCLSTLVTESSLVYFDFTPPTIHLTAFSWTYYLTKTVGT